MMTEQFTGKITDTEKNYSHDDYWLDDKLSLCFEAEKTSSDGLNEPPRVYDTAQRNEQRDHAVAHGGGQRDQDKSQISTTHCFESDILFSQQYKQSKQYDESINQHEKPLSNLLINLPPLLTPSSSSSSDIFQHRTHESNCSTTQQEADMGISDMFGLGLPRGSLVNQQFNGSHSRQHQQQHVSKHAPSTSNCTYQQAHNSASPPSSSIRSGCGRPIRGSSNHYEHASKNAYCKKILILIIIFSFCTLSECLKNNNKNMILKTTTNKPRATTNDKPTIPWDTIKDLISNETNNEANNVTNDQENNLSKSINHLHLVLCILTSSLLSAVYCAYENYWLSLTDMKSWSTMMTSCFMVASLTLQILDEISTHKSFTDVIEIIDGMEFTSTSILLCINYARTSLFTADRFILNQDYIWYKRIIYIVICIGGVHLRIRAFSAACSLMINLIELVMQICLTHGFSLNVIMMNVYNTFIANYMCILKIRVIVIPLLPLFFDLDENLVSLFGILTITRGIFYCNSNLYQVIGEDNDIDLLA